MPRRGKEVTVPVEVHQWLSDLEELTGIRGKGNVMSYIKNIWGESIKQHLQSPMNAVPSTDQVRTVPATVPEVPQSSRKTSPLSRTDAVPGTDPKNARLAALKSRKIGG